MQIEKQYGSLHFTLSHETGDDPNNPNLEQHGDHFVGTFVNDQGHTILFGMDRRTNEAYLDDTFTCESKKINLRRYGSGTYEGDVGPNQLSAQFGNVRAHAELGTVIFEKLGTGESKTTEGVYLDYATVEDDPDQLEGVKVTPVDKINVHYEFLDPDFNCYSYAFHGGKGDPTDPSNGLVTHLFSRWDEDPFDDMQDSQHLSSFVPKQVGDVIVYGQDLNGNGKIDDVSPDMRYPDGSIKIFGADGSVNLGNNYEFLHAAVVTKVDGMGNPIEVRSKNGTGDIKIHAPSNPGDAYKPDNNYIEEWYRPNETSQQRDDRLKAILSVEPEHYDQLDTKADTSNVTDTRSWYQKWPWEWF